MTAAYKVEGYENTKERTVLIGMVTDQTVLSHVASVWDGKLFQSPYANVIGDLCVKHYLRHRSPPKRGIESLFGSWAAEGRQDDLVSLCESFLAGLSAEYERDDLPNPGLIIDQAGDHFSHIRLRRMSQEVEAHLAAGRIDKAEEARVSFRPIQIGVGAGINFFGDRKVVSACLRDGNDQLFAYDGALKEFFFGTLERDSLIAFLAPEKVGKSYWLQDLAYRAMLAHCKVAYIECGDMSEDQVGRRFLARVSGRPYKAPRGQWPYRVKFPTYLTAPAEDEALASVDHEERVFDAPLSEPLAWSACRNMLADHFGSEECPMRSSFHPNSSINVEGIRAKLDAWALEGWTPDVVVIDYADILANPSGRFTDNRDAVNTTWKQLRRLSQELHCLVATATQADADSYDRKLLSRRNFSEDKRKLSHVTGMIGINMTAQEKEKGICRVNWIVRRDGEYSWKQVVHVAGCLAVSQPAVKSIFG